MGRFLTVLIIFYFGNLLHSYSQNDVDYREMFLEAESYFLFEEYREALPLYTKLLKAYPENYNYHYRIGICYLNIAYRKSMSVSHLEKAIEHINPEYKEGSFKETKAPLEAYYYLGNAYRINNQLEKAIVTYNKFKELLDVEIYNIELVDEQIRATKNAIKLRNSPLDFKIENLGERINSRFADVRPIINGDETAIAFVAELQFYDAVFYSEKNGEEWSYPRNLIPEFGVDGDVYTTAFSYDGKEMYLYRSDNFIGNIYTSTYHDGTWSTLTKLNDNINTKYWESHASVSKDGNTLYFSSNRKGGYGALDIYTSKRMSNGDWGPAKNLGPTVNTEFNDDTPFITEDNTLYFSSFGHYSMGGFDIFYSSKLDENRWSVPVNLGYPINTTDDDMHFQPVQNGIYAYYSTFKENNFGRHDIYRLEIFSDLHPRKYEIPGLISIKDQARPNTPFKIILLSTSGNDTIDMLYSDRYNGRYKILAPVGAYKVIIEGKGFETLTEDLIISKKNKDVQLLSEMQPEVEESLTGSYVADTLDKIKVAKDYYEVSTNDEIEIKLILEKDSRLIVETYNNNQHVNNEEFDIDRKKFIYTYKPLPGNNVLIFKMIDKDGNISIKKVIINYKPDEEDEIEPLDSSLIDFYNQLLELAEGDLKKVLENLDLELSDIRSKEELIAYLIEQARFNNYTEDDVRQLLQKLTANLELNELLRKLTILAERELKTVLQNINLNELGISSPKELIQYLFQESINYDYTKGDVLSLLMLIAAVDETDIDGIIDKIITAAPDSLKESFMMLKLKDITTLSQLSDELLLMVENGTLSDDELIDIILKLALEPEMDVHDLLSLLHRIAIGNLKNYLEILDLEKEQLHSISQLVNHLKEEADKQNYSRKELMAILTAISFKGQLNAYLAKLQEIAEGNLKETLNNYNLEENKIIHVPGLLIDLKNKATSGDYTEKDVIDLIIKYYELLTPSDFLNTLLLFADGQLKEFLKGVNLEIEQITSISQLIAYLEEQSQFNAYSLTELIELLIQLLPEEDLEGFMDLLIRITDGKLKKFLRKLDLEKEGITSLTELLNYLLLKADSEEFTKEEILRAFIEALKHLLDPDYEIDSGKRGNYIIYSLIFAGALFIIILILSKRRKKKHQS